MTFDYGALRQPMIKLELEGLKVENKGNVNSDQQ